MSVMNNGCRVLKIDYMKSSEKLGKSVIYVQSLKNHLLLLVCNDLGAKHFPSFFLFRKKQQIFPLTYLANEKRLL